MKGHKLCALIAGPTDKTKLCKFGKINYQEYYQFIEGRARVLAEYLDRLILIPDDGVPLDIAKAYKNNGGGEVIGYIPKEGASHLESYLAFCDDIKEINGGWSVLNTCLSLKSDLMIVFGLSSGTIVEIAYTKYHNKYSKKYLPVMIDLRTISSKLPLEIEDETRLFYFQNDTELITLLKAVRKE